MLGLVRPWVAGLMRQRLAFEDEVLNSPAAPEPGWQGSLEKVAEQMGTPLTARELEVGRLMLSGCSSKEIARKLAISAETVKVHRKHVRQARHQVAVRAVRPVPPGPGLTGRATVPSPLSGA